MFKQSFALAAALACCSCNALNNSSQIAVRCVGGYSTGGDAEIPPIRSDDVRTYVIDGTRNVVYRADPYILANLCSPNGRCDVEVTPSRVTAFAIRRMDGGRTKSQHETKFVLDRDKGELRTTDTVKVSIDDEEAPATKLEGTFTCVSVEVPDFKVPEN